MSRYTLTPTRLLEGIWEGILTADRELTEAPEVVVTHLEQVLAGVTVQKNKDAKHWVLRVPIPAEQIADGVHTYLIIDRNTGERLGHFSLIAGEALGDDLHAEIDLLRAELDMLKRAFRRHCIETL